MDLRGLVPDANFRVFSFSSRLSAHSANSSGRNPVDCLSVLGDRCFSDLFCNYENGSNRCQLEDIADFLTASSVSSLNITVSIIIFIFTS